MQVILMDDVERVGHEGEVITVADGYARNYLIPRGLAVQATKGALKDLDRRRKAIGVREETKRERAEVVARDLAERLVTVKARAGQGDRLHGQVTPQMIAEAVKDQLRMDIDRRDLDIAEPIRELGDYLVSAKLYMDVYAQLPISVVRDTEADEEEAEAAPEVPTPEEEAEGEPQEAEKPAPETQAEAGPEDAEEPPREAQAQAAAEPEAQAADQVEAADEERPAEG